MSRFNIDPKWEDNKDKLWCLAFIVVLTLCVLSATKSCHGVGKDAKEDVYTPDSEFGFIQKANKLFANAVAKGNRNNIKVEKLQDLNRKYPGLTFELPYPEHELGGGRRYDIRLVKINPDSLDNEDDKRFYHNSNLPKLLSDQRKRMGERMFRITFSTEGHNNDSLQISSIQIIPSMFRVPMKKDPWKGQIFAKENALLRASEHCFLSWGHNMVPIKMSRRNISRTDGNTFNVRMDFDRHLLVAHDRDSLSYMKLIRLFESGHTILDLKVGEQNDGRSLAIWMIPGAERDERRLCIKASNLSFTAYASSEQDFEGAHKSASKSADTLSLKEDVKIVVKDVSGNHKITELIVSRHNPMLNLSLLMHSNSGFTRYTIDRSLTDRFTQQIVGGLNSTMRGIDKKDSIRLTIDPLLSMELEKMLAKYYLELKECYSKDSPSDRYELSMTVMDMSNGHIIAAPYFRSEELDAYKIPYEISISRKNPALMRRFIGSTFKPLLALAAVLTDNELIHFGESAADRSLFSMDEDKSVRFEGFSTEPWVKESPYQWNGSFPTSMEDFIAKSNDVYPVALATRAINGGSNYLHNGNAGERRFRVVNGRLKMAPGLASWDANPFIKTLDNLFALPYRYVDDESDDLKNYLWDGLKEDIKNEDGYDAFALDIVTPDPTFLDYTKFNDKDKAQDLNYALVSWVLGQGINEWNSIKLAEAWTRMLTKRQVRATLYADNKYVPAMISGYEGTTYSNATWNKFLDRFNKAQSMGTLLPSMNNLVQRLNNAYNLQNNDKIVLFSKTGTPDNYNRKLDFTIDGKKQYLDPGLFCFALMTRRQFEAVKTARPNGAAAARPPHGVMCVLRFTRISNDIIRGDGMSSSDVRNFFTRSKKIDGKEIFIDDHFHCFYELVKSYIYPN